MYFKDNTFSECHQMNLRLFYSTSDINISKTQLPYGVSSKHLGAILLKWINNLPSMDT